MRDCAVLASSSDVACLFVDSYGYCELSYALPLWLCGRSAEAADAEYELAVGGVEYVETVDTCAVDCSDGDVGGWCACEAACYDECGVVAECECGTVYVAAF